MEHRAISKHQEAQKGWIIGRNGIAMPRSAYILAELLESQREELKLSKAAFCRKLGIPTVTLHKILNGMANPTLAYVATLAEKLDLDFHPRFTQPIQPLMDSPPLSPREPNGMVEPNPLAQKKQTRVRGK